MNFKSLLKNEHLLAILHNVLMNETTKNNTFNSSIKEESYSYNQYSLLVTMDIVIKYQIIINDDIYNNYFANYKNYLLTMDSCVHTRSESDYNNTGAIECYTTYQTPISLLPAYDYINASIDPLCQTVSTGNCTNYNYLAAASHDWWLLNGTNENTYDVYRVNNRGSIALERASVKNYLRVVIAIPSNVLYSSGDGTKDNPYQIKVF